MALVLENVTLANNIKDLNYIFKPGFITALTGKNATRLIEVLMGGCNDYSGNISFEDEDSNSNVIYVTNDDFLYTSKVKDELKLANEVYKLTRKEAETRVLKYFKMFNLDESFFNRLTRTLSKTECYILNMIKALIDDYSVVIFDYVFEAFDYKYTKIIKQFINNLKLMGKTVIIRDSMDILYTLANEIIILGENGTNVSGDVKEVCVDVKLLESLSVEPSLLSLVTYRAKTKKGINISYHKDVRDLIKDIYKHV